MLTPETARVHGGWMLLREQAGACGAGLSLFSRIRPRTPAGMVGPGVAGANHPGAYILAALVNPGEQASVVVMPQAVDDHHLSLQALAQGLTGGHAARLTDFRGIDPFHAHAERLAAVVGPDPHGVAVHDISHHTGPAGRGLRLGATGLQGADQP